MRITFDKFDKGLWVSGPRDQIPRDALRRATGVDRWQQVSVKRRRGQRLLSLVSGAHSIMRFEDFTVLGVGTGLKLYDNTDVAIPSPLNGERLKHAVLTPTSGFPEHLFISGGGKLVKLNKDLEASNWGIQPPVDNMEVIRMETDTITVEEIEDEADWTTGPQPGNPNQIDYSQDTDSDIAFDGNAVRITMNEGNFTHITRVLPVPVDMTRSGALLFSDLDYVTLWFRASDISKVDFIQISFDLTDDADFKRDFYSAVVARDGTAIPVRRQVPLVEIRKKSENVKQLNLQDVLPFLGAQELPEESGAWKQIRIPKVAFLKSGDDSSLDWSKVTAVQLAMKTKAPEIPTAQPVQLWFDKIELRRGSSLVGDYVYFDTLRNSSTGHRSNPNPNGVRVLALDRERVVLSDFAKVLDPQVDQREIWRTVGNGTIPFLIDTIPISQVEYIDTINDTVELADNPEVAGLGQLETNPGVTTQLVFVNNADDFTLINLGTFITVGDEKYTVINKSESGATPVITLDREVAFSPAVDFRFRRAPGPTIQSEELPLDNDPPFDDFNHLTFGNGRAWWTATAEENSTRAFYSALGRPEAVEGYIDLHEGVQTVKFWNGSPWVFTDEGVHQIAGSGEGPLVPQQIHGAPGTVKPDSVIETSRGIVYESYDGLRLFNGVSSVPFGMEAMVEVFDGDGAEDVSSFRAAVNLDAVSPNELFITNGTDLLALDLNTGAWRQIEMGVLNPTAIAYTPDTGELILAGVSGVLRYEDPTLPYSTGPQLEFDVQTAVVSLDKLRKSILQYVVVDIDTVEQEIEVFVVLANGEEIALGTASTSGRELREFTVMHSLQSAGVRVKGSVVGEVELYAAHLEVYNPLEGR